MTPQLFLKKISTNPEELSIPDTRRISPSQGSYLAEEDHAEKDHSHSATAAAAATTTTTPTTTQTKMADLVQQKGKADD